MGGKEIADGGRLETGTTRGQPVLMHRAGVDVSHEDRAEIPGWELVALIDLHSAVGGHVVLVVNNRRKELVGVRVAWESRTRRTLNPARRDVEKVVDHAGADEGVPAAVEIHSPRVAGAVAIDFQAFRAGIEAGDGGD